MPAMKPDLLDAPVVNHTVDDDTVQQRTHHDKDTETTKDNQTKDNHSPSSPINSDVIFETWDMVSN